MENLLLETIIHGRNIGKKKPTFNRWLAHINNWANNWDELVVEETLYILRTKGITNGNYKLLASNDKNNFSSEDKLFKLLWFLALMTPYWSKFNFYFKNSIFLFLIVQPLLHHLPQPHIPKTILIITNMIWKMNGLNKWMPSWRLWNLSLGKNNMVWKKWLKIYKVKRQHQVTH